MSVFLEQQFPLGRFHATRWRENVFEDKHGEWPPSPWRFLRTLAARWIQYSRESGNENIELRDELLGLLASQAPSFYLPTNSWRPEVVPRQYHRTGIEWTAKLKKDSAYKKAMASLVPERFQALPPETPVLWFWDSVDLSEDSRALLHQLLVRIQYFGRAESYCKFRLIENTPQQSPNCSLSNNSKSGQPVLVANAAQKLDLDSLLAATDASEVHGRITPPSAVWQYATLPIPIQSQRTIKPFLTKNENLNAIQFAVGGRVFPTLQHWTRVASRFRGIVLKQLAIQKLGAGTAQFKDLSEQDQQRYSGISGKETNGQPVTDHRHAHFFLVPDDDGLPTRLVCYRLAPFLPEEVDAILSASKRPMSWRPSFQKSRAAEYHDEWQIQMVPLPSTTPLPPGIVAEVPATEWESVTPFVPQGQRHRFRKNGQLRKGETLEMLVNRLSTHLELPFCTVTKIDGSIEWLAVHEPAKERTERREKTTRNSRQGHRLRLSFSKPITGPLFLGHSSHFGLGLFRATTNKSHEGTS